MNGEACMVRTLILWLVMAGGSCTAAFMPAYTNACMAASTPSTMPISFALAWVWTTSHVHNTYLAWSNDLVKVVTWTKYSNSYVPYAGTGQLVSNYWDMTWVSMVPELHDFFADANRYPTPILVDDAQLRIEQLLGIYNDSPNLLFAELWVRPQDLFRPSPDTAITTTNAGLAWPSPPETPPGFATPEAYHAWFTNRAATIYTAATPYPWTQLGYTCDWCPASTTVIGISEYVLKQNSEYYVAATYATVDYIPTTPEPGMLLVFGMTMWLVSRRVYHFGRTRMALP